MSRKPSRSETRRAALARRAALEAMEPRSLITESLGILTSGIGIPAAIAAARPVTTGGDAGGRPALGIADAKATTPVVTPAPASSAGGPAPVAPGSADSVWADLAARAASAPVASGPAANAITLAQPIKPASSAAGGSGGSSHGGSGAVSAPPGAAAPAPPQPGGSATPSNSAALSGSGLASTSPVTNNTPATTSHAIPPAAGPSSPATKPSGVATGGGLAPHISQAALTFTNFPLYTLDYNEGSILLPGTTRLATLGGNVDLRAQVENTTVASYSWNTAGLANATAIAGASTYDLTFQWATTNSAAATNSATLTVTNSTGQTQVQTYNFLVPAGSGSAGTGTASWPTSISPDTVSPGAPSVGAHDVAVDSNSGSADASISLPTYNANVPAVVLAYDSGTAYPQPIIVAHHALDPAQATPSQVSAQLTFNGSAGSTYYYNTSNLTPGDVQQLALQASTSPATGRYSYSLGLGDVRSGGTTTTTLNGSTDVINNSAAAFGAGWTLAGLERIIPAAGGVVLDLGAAGKSLWFAAGSGSTYTDPAGDFSALVANSGGTYTRTLTDGTAIQFNSSGQQVADVDTNGVALTYAYDGSGRLSAITDHYANITTFSYDPTSGLLATIKDPAGRIATFAHSGTGLSGVTLPDSSTWAYAYDGSGRLTQVSDPNSKTVTIAYDPAGRVGTISNPDATSETFVAAQERGFVPAGSGTSGSPAAATLLAEDRSTVIDPLGNETDTYPDWQGLGLADATSDPLGNVATADRDANGLATISVDPLARTSQYTYDSKGNVTRSIYPDGTSTSATYNSLAEPLVTTDELSRVTTNTYDSHGNLTNTERPLLIFATMTYSPTGQVTSDSNPGGGYVNPGAAVQGGGPISYTYDSQDRLTSQKDALGEATTYSYDSAGDRTTVKDPNGNVTTSTYDVMGRVLGTTDALGHATSYAYDPAGNPAVTIDPLGHRTTTAFDAMNRVATVTDALSGVTSYAYDLDGRQASITDSVANQTTYAYDADGRQVGSTDPNGYQTTLTYDADGEVTQQVDKDGRVTNFAYDPRGRQVTEKWMSGGTTLETITHTYDNAGELTALTDGTTLLTYTYDNDGRQSGAGTSGSSGQPALALTSAYYASDAIASLTDNLATVGGVSYSYDAAFRLKFLAEKDGPAYTTVTFGYDAGNRLTSLSRSPYQTGPLNDGGYVNTSFGYDAANRLTSITDQTDGGTALDAQSYGYDNANRLTSETNAEGSVTYGYDAIDELTGVTGARSETYTYDHNGNRTMTGYATAANNETTAGAGYTYAYDHEGNLTGKTQTSTGNAWTYTWDYRNRLTGVVEKNSGGTILMQGTYTYDALDRRIGVDETVSGTETKTWTVYNGVNPYADFNGSGTLLTRYLYGPGADQILARTSAAGTTAYYLTDHEGSIRDVVNTSGAVIDHVAYDSYGNVTSESSPSSGDRFKFDGMAWDASISIYYDNARYYDSVAGKFLSQDPMAFSAKDTNIYRFTCNDPVDYTDPSGFQKWVEDPSKVIPPGFDVVQELQNIIDDLFGFRRQQPIVPLPPKVILPPLAPAVPPPFVGPPAPTYGDPGGPVGPPDIRPVTPESWAKDMLKDAMKKQ